MGDVLNAYGRAVTEAMTWLAAQPRTIFVGQAVEYDSQALFKTFADVPATKRLEMPVAEDFQMGFCTGLALEGYIPICFFPRMDFLVLALNHLVNHLDKIPITSFHPKVIIRAAVGSTEPLDAGPQHTQDHTAALREMLTTVDVITLTNHETIVREYMRAYRSPGSKVMIEYMRRYR